MAIAEGFVGSLTLGVGQFCTNPGLVVSGSAGRGEFAGQVAAKAADTAPATMLHKGIAAAYHEAVGAMTSKDSVESLAEVEADGGNNQAGTAVLGTSAGAFLADQSMADEMFGPATLMIEAGDEEDYAVDAERERGQALGHFCRERKLRTTMRDHSIVSLEATGEKMVVHRYKREQ